MSEGPLGWVLEGHLARRFREGPARVSYLVETDRRWRTRKAIVEQVIHGDRCSLEVEVRGSMWYVSGRKDERLHGSVDVDLGASPVTNSLPINRVRLKVGEGVELTAAWVRFPDLEVMPLVQSYRRVGERTYSYRSSSGFSSKIEVDGFGLVRRYGDFWRAL